MRNDLSIGIVGGGIGGLAAALSLLRGASRIQCLSEANKTRLHLPDGAAQQARDDEMARGATDWSLKAIAWLYGHDAGEPERNDS